MGGDGVQQTLMVIPSCVADSPVGGAAAETGKDNGQHKGGVMDKEMFTSSPGTVMVWALSYLTITVYHDHSE